MTRIRDSHREHLKARYGLTPEEYQSILTRQNGACAICQRHPRKRRLAVDHDHGDGHVRGLLCDRCNRGLEWVADSHRRFYGERGCNCPCRCPTCAYIRRG